MATWRIECRTLSGTGLGTRSRRHTGGETSSSVTRSSWTVKEGGAAVMERKLRDYATRADTRGGDPGRHALPRLGLLAREALEMHPHPAHDVGYEVVDQGGQHGGQDPGDGDDRPHRPGVQGHLTGMELERLEAEEGADGLLDRGQAAEGVGEEPQEDGREDHRSQNDHPEHDGHPDHGEDVDVADG